jgi:hypothetical protein
MSDSVGRRFFLLGNVRRESIVTRNFFVRRQCDCGSIIFMLVPVAGLFCDSFDAAFENRRCVVYVCVFR